MDARIQWIWFPHLCVGFLFLVLYPAVRSSASVISHTTHTPPFTHTICHTQLWHISLNFSHRTFVSHNLSHTISHTHSFTHLLRTVIANSDVECILRAKNTPVKPDRNWLMTRGEKQCEGILSMSLLKQRIHLNQVVISLDRLRQLRSKKEKQKPIVRNGRYAGLIRPSIPWLW